MAEATHLRHALASDVAGKHWTGAVPPVAYRLGADVMPRFASRSSTFRNDSGKRTYTITTSPITSGEELKDQNGLAVLLLMDGSCPAATSTRCTVPRSSDRGREANVVPRAFEIRFQRIEIGRSIRRRCAN